ncbi:hypothetical protein [Micromonospora sp. RP3T]|uniref:hypothetical protein n=1 Tax=Micromonospora sp. RP3T TaxID=2135446 RepID=UPI0021022391|nr:hypothetical protein [Micromonospora sp. RP3T]
MTRRFRHLVTDSGLAPVCLHDLRHGAASLADSTGADLKAVQEQLGHTASCSPPTPTPASCLTCTSPSPKPPPDSSWPPQPASPVASTGHPPDTHEPQQHPPPDGPNRCQETESGASPTQGLAAPT